jgi:Anti-sigma-K factor rskA
MSDRSHERIEELLAVRALGGLETPDLAELDRMMAEHGDCEECRRLEAEMAETASMLAFALEPEPVGAAMADRVLGVEADTTADRSPPAPADEVAERRERRSRKGWLAVAGVAAAAVLVLVAVSVTTSTTEVGEVNWAQQVVVFDGEEGELSMAYVPGESGAVLWGEGLPDPGEGNVYEIWMIRDGQPIRGGCVEPVDGRVATFIDAQLSPSDVMAVTVEQSACPNAPTTDPVFVAPLV